MIGPAVSVLLNFCPSCPGVFTFPQSRASATESEGWVERVDGDTPMNDSRVASDANWGFAVIPTGNGEPGRFAAVARTAI